MHVSCFVFRDTNGDGTFDLGDRPFSYAAVVLERDSSLLALERSNVSGFANFSASVMQTGAQIRTPGIYELNVAVPPGWRITTGNGAQSIEVLSVPGAPGDLGLLAAATLVGLAPIPEIRGTALADKTVAHLRGPDMTERIVEVAGGAFAIPVEPGHWEVDLQSPAAEPLTYDVAVGTYPVALPRRPPGPQATAPASDTTVGFDDLIGVEAVAAIPSGYGGLTWLNWVVTHNRTYQGEGYINGTLSGEYVAYNGSGNPAAIERAEPFDFIGGHFGVAWARAEGETAYVRAWRGKELLHEDEFRLSALGPVSFAAGYAGITRLEFMTGHSWQMVADDLSFRLGPPFRSPAGE